jgi:8-oxo-dGTP pyrophosphatase MutT (NUDIX family)
VDPARRLPDDTSGRTRQPDGSEAPAVPAVPRDASTVVLLREGDGREGGLGVYLLRRARAMAFAAGSCVFPGGGVDPRDADASIGWAGPSAQAWGDLLGTSGPLARALVCAAVRETFEESGVLLAGPATDTVVGDTTGAAWENDRRRLEAREVAFSEVLARRRLVLRTDLLVWWGSWITPVQEPRRYDTRFFLARLPEGQVTRDVSSESEEVLWLPVREVLDAVDAGRLTMLPPTYVTCLELLPFRTVDQALAAAAGRDRSTVEPSLVAGDDGTRLEVPSRIAALLRTRSRHTVAPRSQGETDR